MPTSSTTGFTNPGLASLLCDGGNKAKEWKLLNISLKPGDMIGAHDWCDETMPKYQPGLLDNAGDAAGSTESGRHGALDGFVVPLFCVVC